MLALDRTIGSVSARFDAAFPTFRSPARRLLARRWWLLYAAAVAEGATQTVLPVDTIRFRHLGFAVLHLDLGRVYAYAWDQSGPFQLIVSYLLCAATGTTVGTILVHVAGNVCMLAVAHAGCRALRREAGLANSAVIELVLGTVCVAWFFPGRLWEAHPAELINPLLWIAAGVAARRGRGFAAGALIGLSTGWEIWGALGVPMLLLLPSVKRMLGAGTVFAATTATMYLPFAASGRFHLFDKVWPVVQGTPLHIFFPHLQDMPWQLRLLQGAAATASACAVIFRFRGTASVVWLAPTAAVVTRFLFDPVVVDYYWTPVTVLTFAGLTLVSRHTRVWELAALLALSYLPLVIYGEIWRYDLAAFGLVALLALVATRVPREEDGNAERFRRFHFDVVPKPRRSTHSISAVTQHRLPVPAMSGEDR